MMLSLCALTLAGKGQQADNEPPDGTVFCEEQEKEEDEEKKKKKNAVVVLVDS